MLSGGLLLVYGVGAVAGPIISSIAMGGMGPGGLFLFTAVVHTVLLLYIVNRTLRRSAPKDSDQVPFDDALAAARTTSQVYEDGIE